MLTLPTLAHHRHADDWQRTDGGVWLPRDPMRGAGMVRRGMGFGFEPAGCCCVSSPCKGCTDCFGNYDDEYDLTFSGIVNNPDYTLCSPVDCSIFNATFRVTKDPNTQYGCYWVHGNYETLCGALRGVPRMSLLFSAPCTYLVQVEILTEVNTGGSFVNAGRWNIASSTSQCPTADIAGTYDLTSQMTGVQKMCDFTDATVQITAVP